MMKKAKKKARAATTGTDFRISLLRDEQMPDRPCVPGDVMIELAKSGKLPNFQREFGAPRPHGLSDCHDVTLALMVDLIAAERADGWSWVQGSIVTGHGERFDHSWLEHDGWAVDVANGKVLVMRSSRYDEMTKAEQTTVRDAVQTSAWMTSGPGSPTERLFDMTFGAHGPPRSARLRRSHGRDRSPDEEARG